MHPKIKVSDIQDAVAAHYRIPRDAIIKDCRVQHFARPRHIAMYLARQWTDHSLPALGRMFDRDHSTIIHAIKTVRPRLCDQSVANDIFAIRKLVNATVERREMVTEMRRAHNCTAGGGAEQRQSQA